MASMMKKARLRALHSVTLFEPTREWIGVDHFGGKHIWQPNAERWAALLVRRERGTAPIKRKRYAGHHDSARSASA